MCLASQKKFFTTDPISPSVLRYGRMAKQCSDLA
ncbi:hypothetical protein SPHINGOT1_460013 [Sphingomonas sp. T1]|nr:hypothetical protein SPHINGOT1_460013 [Sphingomonas sp. T1]